MKPLIVLLGAFAISVMALKLITGGANYPLAGRIAMAAMLAFTAIGHFAFTKGMMMMLPDRIPFKRVMVYATGLIELCAAPGLLLPSLKIITGWLLIIFFILLLPANIHAALRHVDYQKGTYSGDGPNYLWFRIPLQILFIAWAYFSAVRF